MSSELPVNDFKWVEVTSQFSKDFIEHYNEERDEVYFLKLDVQQVEVLHNLSNRLHFWPERMKIEKNVKVVADLNNKKEYVLHIRNLKQEPNHGLVLTKDHSVIKFQEKAWIDPFVQS